MRISYKRLGRSLEYVSYADIQLHIRFIDRNSVVSSSRYAIDVFGDSNVVGLHKIGHLILYISHDHKAYIDEDGISWEESRFLTSGNSLPFFDFMNRMRIEYLVSRMLDIYLKYYKDILI